MESLLLKFRAVSCASRCRFTAKILLSRRSRVVMEAWSMGGMSVRLSALQAPCVTHAAGSAAQVLSVMLLHAEATCWSGPHCVHSAREASTQALTHIHAGRWCQ